MPGTKGIAQLRDWLKHKSPESCLGDMGIRLEERIGKIAFSGRYHREPRKLEDDYVLSQSVLGSGCNGDVLMATSIAQAGHKFAVKTLSLAGDAVPKEGLAQLRAEVENYLCMDHPHIIRLYDVYESKQELRLVMECAEGGELFDRVLDKKQFEEAEAREALRQMLLALNYIHSHGIVHRDVKLENFIYDSKSKNGHLKLIDFGFSKVWAASANENMGDSLGTLAYAAPEVLQQNYTSQCDMWSLGVIGFILLGGYMPFAGSEQEQMRCICKGKYPMKPEQWGSISLEAQHLITSLLEVDPDRRLTAQQALEHPWITQSCECNQALAMKPCCEALREFSRASKFRRCCLEMLAWSLSNKDQDKVRDIFLRLDENHQGTITLAELRHVMVEEMELVDEDEVLRVFQALDYNHDQEIHYSEFLAAMVATQIDVNDEVLTDGFRRFDVNQAGYITAENLRDVLGRKVDGEKVEAFIREADQNMDGVLSFAEFAAYVRGTHSEQLEATSEAQSGRPKRQSIVKSALKGLRTRFHCFGPGSAGHSHGVLRSSSRSVMPEICR